MTIYIKALEILKTGNEDAAWNIAKDDSGLATSITKEVWLKFAKNNLNAVSAATKQYAKYGN